MIVTKLILEHSITFLEPVPLPQGLQYEAPTKSPPTTEFTSAIYPNELDTPMLVVFQPPTTISVTTTSTSTTTSTTTTTTSTEPPSFTNGEYGDQSCGLLGANAPPLMKGRTRTTTHDWPWIAAIFLQNFVPEFKCAGNLITSSYVLTGIMFNYMTRKFAVFCYVFSFWGLASRTDRGFYSKNYFQTMVLLNSMPSFGSQKIRFLFESIHTGDFWWFSRDFELISSWFGAQFWQQIHKTFKQRSTDFSSK